MRAAEAGARHSDSELAIVAQLNQVRAQNNLPRLRASGSLGRAADSHSRDMLRNDFFSHPSSDGTPFEQRVRRFANANGVGEMLAVLGQRHGGAADAVRLWMESPPHRAIILNGQFRRVGIARRWGQLNGAAQAVVTADFATRG